MLKRSRISGIYILHVKERYIKVKINFCTFFSIFSVMQIYKYENTFYNCKSKLS